MALIARRPGDHYRRGYSRISAASQLADTGSALLLAARVQRSVHGLAVMCQAGSSGLDEPIEVEEQSPQFPPGRTMAEGFAGFLHGEENEKLRANAAECWRWRDKERRRGFANGGVEVGLPILRTSEAAGLGTAPPGLLATKQDLLEAVASPARRNVLRDGGGICGVADGGTGWRRQSNPRVVEFGEKPGFETVAAPECGLVPDDGRFECAE